MDFSTLFNSLQGQLGQHLPGIFGALAVLIGGWLIAVVVRAGLNRFLNMIGINKRISESTGQEVDIASGISLGAFILILLITLIGVFSSLNLQAVSEPFNVMVTQIFQYLPRIFAGLILLAIAWAIATLVRLVTTKALSTTKLDEKLSAEAGMQPMSNNVGNMLFWIIILMFLPALLSTFELNGLLAPVQGMVDEFLAMVPNIFAGGVIALVGWIVAKILRGLVTNILATSGIDNISKAVDQDGKNAIKLSNVIGMLVFIFVFIPTLIAALDALQMEAISLPASNMLTLMFEAVPNILAAAIILTITYYVAKFVASLAVNLLSGIGFNEVPARLGFKDTFTKSCTISDLVGKVLVFFAMLFATVEAANRLGFGEVSDIVSIFIQFGGDILLGSVILIVGFWLSNLAYNAIDRASGKKTSGLASIARVAIIGLVIAMGLRAMGIADDIVNMAFGLTLGSVAVAVALAFGLGGRDAAGKQLEYWFSKMRKDDK
jgi:Mechanosensitive ion channel, conserved TM helix